jgi:hypothetical protein
MELTMTLTDPKTYTRPWVTGVERGLKAATTRNPTVKGSKIGELGLMK